MESEEVAMMLGSAGEAFFLRQVLKDDADGQEIIQENTSTIAQNGRYRQSVKIEGSG